jgi:lipopolysaccharide biosynthesis glycosyltransferase
VTAALADDRIVIASGGDDAFAMAVAVSVYSALHNLPRDVEPVVYLLSDGISEQNRSRIEEVLRSARAELQLTWLTPDLTAVDGVTPSPWNTRATYLRLFIPELLHGRHRRAIYIDGDVIVAESLMELWGRDLEGRMALAVENYSDPTVATGLSRTYQALGLAPTTPYFNAGVLVVDLERWHSESVGRRVLAFLREYGERAPFADQDGLNAILAGDWVRLHPRWNVQLLTLDTYGHESLRAEDRALAQAELLRSPAILHYTGPCKPWHVRYRGPAGRTFARYVGRSGWYPRAAYLRWAATRELGHYGTRHLGPVYERLKAWRRRKARGGH